LIKLILDFFTSFVEVIKLMNGHAECTDETISEYPFLTEALNGDNNSYFRHLCNEENIKMYAKKVHYYGVTIQRVPV
jgi:hypothetical protein